MSGYLLSSIARTKVRRVMKLTRRVRVGLIGPSLGSNDVNAILAVSRFVCFVMCVNVIFLIGIGSSSQGTGLMDFEKVWLKVYLLNAVKEGVKKVDDRRASRGFFPLRGSHSPYEC